MYIEKSGANTFFSTGKLSVLFCAFFFHPKKNCELKKNLAFFIRMLYDEILNNEKNV